MVNVPYPDMSVQVAMNARANSGDNPRWTNISELVVSADGISRGHPYQVPTGQSSNPKMTIRDPQELFNPANTVDSPFIAGTGGRSIQPVRGVCWQFMHPRGTTGNILNLNNWRVPVDPSFESYAVGPLPAWVQGLGPNIPTIVSAGALQGTRSVSLSVGVGGGLQGIQATFQCIPGRYYLVQCLVNQGAANTVSLFLSGHNDVATTTAITTTPLSGVFWADQPLMTVVIGVHTPANNTTLLIDAIMIEPVYPVNPTGANFNGQNGGTGSLNGWAAGGGATATVDATAAGFNLKEVHIHPNGVGTPTFTSPFFAVNPNTPYALNGVLLNNGINRTISVNWYTAGQALISSNTITGTGGTDFATLSDPPLAVTSPGTAALATLSTAGAAAAPQDWWVDSICLLPATPSAFTTTGPVIYPVLRDWVERWPRRHDSNGFEGYSDLQLVDGLAALAAIKLDTEYVAGIKATAPGPTYLWRLNEPANATVFGESSGNAGPPLQVFTVGGQNFQAGVASGVLGDPGGAGVQVGNSTPGASTTGSYLANAVTTPLAGLGGTGASWAVSFAFWLSYDDTVTSAGGILMTLASSAFSVGVGGMLQIVSNGPGGGITGQFIGSNGNAQVFSSAFDYGDKKPHHYIITMSLSAGTITLTMVIDGVSFTTSSATGIGVWGTNTPIVSLTTMCVGNQTLNGPVFPRLGTSVHSVVAIWNRALTPSEITNIYTAGIGYPGELPSARLARHLGHGGYLTGTSNIPASRISAGRSVLSPSTVADRSTALDDGQRITLAEMGTLWIAPDGALVMESRDDRFLRTNPVTTFGEDIANGECPYIEGYLYDFDPQYLYADVRVSQSGGVTVIGGRVPDIQAATATLFGRSFSPQNALDLQSALMTQDYADWTFYTHNVPQQRIEAVTIDPMSNPALWAFIANVELGQRIRVRRRPRGLLGNLVIDQQYFVEQIIHGQINFDTSGDQPLSWKTSLSLTPATSISQPWILDDPTWSQLGNTTRLGV